MMANDGSLPNSVDIVVVGGGNAALSCLEVIPSRHRPNAE